MRVQGPPKNSILMNNLPEFHFVHFAFFSIVFARLISSRALEYTGRELGSSRISVSESSPDEFQNVTRSSASANANNSGPDIVYCISMRELPFGTTEHDINMFFAGNSSLISLLVSLLYFDFRVPRV